MNRVKYMNIKYRNNLFYKASRILIKAKILALHFKSLQRSFKQKQGTYSHKAISILIWKNSFSEIKTQQSSERTPALQAFDFNVSQRSSQLEKQSDRKPVLLVWLVPSQLSMFHRVAGKAELGRCCRRPTALQCASSSRNTPGSLPLAFTSFITCYIHIVISMWRRWYIFRKDLMS